MPWSGQEELQRTKARLVREQRQRTLRRQRELLSPPEELYNSDSDSDTKSSHRSNIIKLDRLSKQIQERSRLECLLCTYPHNCCKPSGLAVLYAKESLVTCASAFLHLHAI
jgi:hypothetical protein